jgi:hypothetical protein
MAARRGVRALDPGRGGRLRRERRPLPSRLRGFRRQCGLELGRHERRWGGHWRHERRWGGHWRQRGDRQRRHERRRFGPRWIRSRYCRNRRDERRRIEQRQLGCRRQHAVCGRGRLRRDHVLSERQRGALRQRTGRLQRTRAVQVAHGVPLPGSVLSAGLLRRLRLRIAHARAPPLGPGAASSDPHPASASDTNSSAERT